MNRSVGQPYLRGPDSGFTLLEVLVALVIVSLGMIAVFSQLTQMVKTTSRLRDKTLAHWIAVDQITELKALAAYPSVGEKRDEVDMAHTTWSYTVKTSQIGDLGMRRVDVSVAFADFPDDVLAEVSGFLAAPQQAFAQPGGAPNQPQQPGGPTGQPGQQPVDPQPQANTPQIPAGAPGLPDNGPGTGFGKGWDPLDPNEYATQ